MKKLFDTARNTPLFAGIAFSDFTRMLQCMAPKTATYQKNDVILLSGDTVNFVGLILAGAVHVMTEDREGRGSIVTELGVSELFGETLACAGVAQSPVTVLAAEDAEILFMDYRKVISSCSSACPFHTKLIENMLTLLAHKNLMLHRKLDLLSKRTTREKLLCFFDMQRGPAKKFSIPYNREELAHYLCVDRSAMSSELGKMRAEGLIDFQKNSFEIL